MQKVDDGRPEIPDLVVAVSPADHSLGEAAARITLVEYGDYECPDCLNAQPIVAVLRQRLGSYLRIVFRHFPQSSVHRRASVAAAAAEAAARQDRFWEMHEELFRRQRELADVDFTHLALVMGLEVYRFQSDLESEASAARVRSDYTGGVLCGVKGTPTFFINGRRYPGEVTLDALHSAMASL